MGYVFEQHNQVLFLPMNTNLGFLSQVNGKVAYRIYEFCGYEQLKYGRGDTIVVNMRYEDTVRKERYVIEEKVLIVPAIIVYTRDAKRTLFQSGEMEFDVDRKTYRFIAYSDHYTKVYQVVGVAGKSD